MLPRNNTYAQSSYHKTPFLVQRWYPIAVLQELSSVDDVWEPTLEHRFSRSSPETIINRIKMQQNIQTKPPSPSPALQARELPHLRNSLSQSVS